MRRNKGVAKRVLKVVRDLDESEGVSLIHVFWRCEKEGDATDEIRLTVELLKASGYLTETTHILKITWSGHDLLESLEAEFLEEMRVAMNRR